MEFSWTRLKLPWLFPALFIISNWKKLGTVANLKRSGCPSKIPPRTQRRLIQEVTKDPRTAWKELHASLASIKVTVQTLAKNAIPGRVVRRKPLLTQKNIEAHLNFAKTYLDDLKPFGRMLWELMKWKGSPLENESYFIWVKPNTEFHKKNIIPALKHGGCSVLMWGCFAGLGPG